MSFEKQIQKWVSLDNQLKILNEKTRDLRGQKNDISENIFQYVETNQLSNATVKISDGKLRFGASKQTNPLTLKYVESCLNECISNKEQVEHVMRYIKDSRETKETPDIKRTYAK